jgi:tellurite resistance protein TehA-like permease
VAKGRRWTSIASVPVEVGFSPAMAIGITSVAARIAGYATLSAILLAAGATVYLVLLAGLLAARLDASGPSTGGALGWQAGLTFVAASCVLGTRLAPTGDVAERLALALWLAGALVLAGLSCIRGARASASRGLPSSEAFGGDSFLVVVAPQSLAILAASLVPLVGRGALVVGAALWAAGLVLYGLVACGLSARIALGRLGRSDFGPDYWVTMGALAITTVAAIDLRLAERGRSWPQAWTSGVEHLARATWAAASLLIVLLLLAELWQAHGDRVRWSVSRWTMVFPLGMYSVASQELRHVWALDGVGDLGKAALWVALSALLVTLGVTVRDAIGRRDSPSESGPASTSRP